MLKKCLSNCRSTWEATESTQIQNLNIWPRLPVISYVSEVLHPCNSLFWKCCKCKKWKISKWFQRQESDVQSYDEEIALFNSSHTLKRVRKLLGGEGSCRFLQILFLAQSSHSVRCPSVCPPHSVTSNIVSTIWCFKPHKPYILLRNVTDMADISV